MFFLALFEVRRGFRISSTLKIANTLSTFKLGHIVILPFCHCLQQLLSNYFARPTHEIRIDFDIP